MKKKAVSRKISWVLAMGLAMSNPMNLHAEESEAHKNGQTDAIQVDGTEEADVSSEATEAETVTEHETEASTQTETETTTEQTEKETFATEAQTQSEDFEDSSEDREKKRKKAPQKETDEKSEETQETQKGNVEAESIESITDIPGSQAITVQPEAIREDFRFVRVEGELAAASAHLYILEEMDDEARAVGTLEEGGVCYILKASGDWLYVESGVVRGFVRMQDVLQGEEAREKIQQRRSYLSAALSIEELNGDREFLSYSVSVESLEQEESEEIEWEICYGVPLVEPMENQALAYTRTTTREIVAEKVCGIAALENVPILGERNREEQLQTGILSEGSLCYILEDTKDGWYYVESGDVRGFVEADQLLTGEEARQEIETKGEEAFSLAEKCIEPEDNPALYYTLASIKEGEIAGAIRTSMVKFAVSFVGNPYVWGGTSLSQGADCSGFVQSVYAQYGYSLPRVAADQAQYGTRISVSEALPGDLIFYEENGEIYHVVMYIGDGKVVEAANTDLGIITSQVRNDQAVWAVRIISDLDEDVIKAVNGSGVSGEQAGEEDYGVYLGKFKLTSYCSCVLCCGQWANGVTSSGTIPVEGRTVAMAGVPFGTRLVIRNQIYVVEDRGTPYGHADIYKNDHENSRAFGVQYADVYLAN